jgi:hypothetical protein
MSTQKLLRNILSELPGAVAEHGRKHIRVTLPNGRFVTVSSSPHDEDIACRNALRHAKQELQR